MSVGDLTKTRPFVVGTKQTVRALSEGRATRVYLARDADPALQADIRSRCERAGVAVEDVSTMMELGRAAGIEVRAAAVATVRDET